MSKYLNKYTKDQHRVYSLHYHLILIVKYRKAVFTNETNIINDLKNYIESVSSDFDVIIIEQECGDDHIHILFESKPTLDIPKYLNILKGHSSRFLRKKYKEYLKDKLWGDSFWSPSYFLATTGNVSIDILKQYVENHKD